VYEIWTWKDLILGWPRYRLVTILPDQTSSSDLSKSTKRSHDICSDPTLTGNNQINGIMMR
jgi:hypothetical protein